jgi:hypothetical protein
MKIPARTHAAHYANLRHDFYALLDALEAGPGGGPLEIDARELDRLIAAVEMRVDAARHAFYLAAEAPEQSFALAPVLSAPDETSGKKD